MQKHPKWAECSQCKRVASYGIIQPWGSELLCGHHVKNYLNRNPEKFKAGWWKLNVTE